MVSIDDVAKSYWQYSLSLYAVPGIADACLALQDAHGVNVNVLLFFCFARDSGMAIDSATLESIVLSIEASEAQLFEHRRLRKNAKPTQGARCNNYEQLKSQELDLERVQQKKIVEAYVGKSHHNEGTIHDFCEFYALNASGESQFYFIIQQI